MSVSIKFADGGFGNGWIVDGLPVYLYDAEDMLVAMDYTVWDWGSDTGTVTLWYAVPGPQTLKVSFQMIGLMPGTNYATVDKIHHKELRYRKGEVVTQVCNGEGGDYRFGFNGKMKDNEMKGIGNSYDYGFRMYDPRIGRPFAPDPLFRKFPMLSTYQFFSNTPIMAVDLDGLEAKVVITDQFYQRGIQTAVKKSDFMEAERLTWEAVWSKDKSGHPSAKFIPDPNGITGFGVYMNKPNLENIIFSRGNNTYYKGPDRSWPKGGIDPGTIRYIDKEVRKREARIDRLNDRRSSLQNQINKLEGDFNEFSKSIQEGRFGDPETGSDFGIIVERLNVNRKVNTLKSQMQEIDTERTKLGGEVQELKDVRQGHIELNNQLQQQ